MEKFSPDSLIIGTRVMSTAGSYALIAQARILGALCRERQEEVGWVQPEL